MRVIRSAVIASLLLVPWILAPSVRAEDQPLGTGTPAQMETQKGTTVERADIQPNLPDIRDLSKWNETHMKVPEGGEFIHFRTKELRVPDLSDVEISRDQDLKSATSF